MIVPMRKVYIAGRGHDRDRLLQAVRDLGVVHLVPVDPAQAVLDERMQSEIREAELAVQSLSRVEPTGGPPNVPPEQVVEEVLEIERRTAERQSRLNSLYRQLEQVRMWGDVRLEQFRDLREAGIEVKFYAVPETGVGEITAECVQVLNPLPGKKILVGLVQREGEPTLPDSAEAIPLPQRDAPSIKAEAAEVDAAIKADAERLGELAHLKPKIEQELLRRREEGEYTVAMLGAFDTHDVVALQGWVPADRADGVVPGLEKTGVDVAVYVADPDPDEEPPTLIDPPKWASPIQGLFNILGTVAGYREYDVSPAFMVALPIFGAMLICDGGYGLLLLLGLGLGYRKIGPVLGEKFTQLLLVIGGLSVVWGLLTGGFFGVTLYNAPVPVNLSDSSRFRLMQISFMIGAIHLTLAKVWLAIRLYPDLRFLNPLGWALFIWGIWGIVRYFVLNAEITQVTLGLLLVGAVITILFAAPQAGIVKRLGLGLADFPLSVLSAFSDVISYVRLMAVGLASSVLATSFNQLGTDVGILPITILVLIAGHGLNLGLAMIALFAHGVRLNMLEFSNNLGMQWTGTPYSPFLRQSIEET